VAGYGLGASTLELSTMTSKSWSLSCGCSRSSRADTFAWAVVVTRPTFQPRSLAALIVSATPGRGARPAVARLSRKIFDFDSWMAWALTVWPRDFAYSEIRSWPPFWASMAR
jgi:hypothetical protein